MSQSVAICTTGRQSHIVSAHDETLSECGKTISRVVGRVGDVVRQPSVTLTRYDGSTFTTEAYDILESASCRVCFRHQR